MKGTSKRLKYSISAARRTETSNIERDVYQFTENLAKLYDERSKVENCSMVKRTLD
jgi:hypothetical protein